MTQKRGRASVASLSIAAVSGLERRPKAPVNLTSEQSEAWTAIVDSEPASAFKTKAAQTLLEQYVRHLSSASLLAASIDGFESAWIKDPEGLERFDRLLKMRERETRAMASVGTKLRITSQATWTAKARGTAAANLSVGHKPWEPRL